MSDCPICFELIDDMQNVVITICQHKFHTTCLFRSTQSSGYRCPNCRGCLLATDSATGPTGAAETRGAYSYQDASMNLVHAITGPSSRTRVTYHNDSSDDEYIVRGG